MASTEPLPNFEQALESLESIVHDLEEGQVGLAESLAKYELGVKLLKQCYELLARAERRIELLSRVEATGEAVTEPFDDSPTATQTPVENAATTRRRRSRSATAKRPAEPDAGGVAEGTDDGSNEMDVPGGLF